MTTDVSRKPSTPAPPPSPTSNFLSSAKRGIGQSGIFIAFLAILALFAILTKGTMLTRDLGLLGDAAARVHVGVSISLALLSDDLHPMLEPGTPSPRARLALIRRIRGAALPCGVLLAPILPHLTDSIAALDDALARIRAAGAARVVYGALHLRPGAKQWFLDWLEREHPHLVSSYRGLYPGVSATAPMIPGRRPDRTDVRAGQRRCRAPPRARGERTSHRG